MSSTSIKKKASLESLPDDLLFICIARVSRLYYVSLSLVSKRFRSLIASPELYKTRSLLGRTESCLYVCLSVFPEYRWFTLYRKPNDPRLPQRKESDWYIPPLPQRKESDRYVLAHVPFLLPPPAHFSSLVAVGSDIYNIGGAASHAPSSTVSVLDCVSHTWRQAPSLPVELRTVSATSFDHKIYVGGRFRDGLWFEVFDTKTQIWDHVPSPLSKRENEFIYSKVACIGGIFHVKTDRNVIAYNSEQGRWNVVEGAICDGMFSDAYCKIGNVWYSASGGVLRWYDINARMWKMLNGLLGLPRFKLPPGACVRLVDYGGKMVVLWKENWACCGSGNGIYNKSKMIWCAEIALERRSSWEIWGRVEWFGHVLTLPKSFSFVKVLAATL